jgi:hypothetical protein
MRIGWAHLGERPGSPSHLPPRRPGAFCVASARYCVGDEAFKRVIEALNRRDIESLLESYDPDVEARYAPESLLGGEGVGAPRT